nr:pilus (MSHA type) biogenesis protein MshL [Campylobacter avium]
MSLSLFLCLNLHATCSSRLFDVAVVSELSNYEILEHFSKLCSFSIILKDDLAKEKLELMQKNINAKQVSLDELFDLLIKEQNLHYDYNGKILRISSIKTQSFKLNYITSVREGQSVTKASVDSKSIQNDYSNTDVNLDDNMIKSLEKFDFWQNIEKEIQAILSSENEKAASPIINQNAGLITVSGSAKQLQRVQTYIQNLQNRLKKQVIIDVSIIAVSLDKSSSSGINWQNFNLTLNSNNQENAANNGFILNLGLNANLDSVMNFLSQNGKTRTLSNPKLLALNNQQAIISVGDTINYQVRESSKSTESGTTVSESYNNYSIFVGILLNILPEISDDGKIMLRINPSLSSFKYAQDNKRQESPRTIAPDTVQKKLSTVVSMENEQTLILGGLISHSDSTDESSVNFLSKIPVLSWFFEGSNEVSSSTEIVFIIKPIIIDTQEAPTLSDLGFSI